MIVNNDPRRTSNTPDGQRLQAQLGSAADWKDIATRQTNPRRKRRRRILAITITLLLLMLILTTVRLSTVISDTNDQLLVQIGNQQTAVVDLRQSEPISPYLFGVNVFPEAGSNSVDADFTGFMDYTPSIIEGLKNAQIKLLRFPGGNWSERQNSREGGHILSLDQLNDFSLLLNEVGAEGIIQARLSNPIDGTGIAAQLTTRANLAGRWVDYMNNPKSDLRTGKYAHAPFHPIKFWTVGNEPDRIINPSSPTNDIYTVSDYVNEFIEYSKVMHQNDPTIKVFGPEISQFYGLGAGPVDAQGQLWMESFLKGVAKYEHAHPELKFHLLDGVSFHRYPFLDARTQPDLLLSSSAEWNYLLPPLRQLIRQDFNRDLPVAVTEINTNPNGEVPTPGIASLWWADTLATLMNQQVDYVGFFSAEGVNTPYPLFAKDGQHQTAMFRVMQLFSYLQHNLIPLGVQHDPVSLYATEDDAHQAVSLLFINKSSNTQLVQVSPANQVFGVGPWHSQDISLAAYSMVLVTLHHNADAEAYSFIVPAIDDPNLHPLNHVICGHKTDALANYIPC
jgi:hypothetical protein